MTIPAQPSPALEPDLFNLADDSGRHAPGGAIVGIYLWLALGIVVAGAAAWWFQRLGLLEGAGWLSYPIMAAVWLLGLLVVVFISPRAPPTLAAVPVLAYHVWSGATAAHFFDSWTNPVLLPAGASIAATLLLMAVYCAPGRRSLTGWRTTPIVALVGLAAAALAQLVIGFALWSWLATSALTLLLLWLTFAQSRKLTGPAPGNTRLATGRAAIASAIDVYLYLFSLLVTIFRIGVLQDNALYRRRLEVRRDTIDTLPPPPPPVGISGF